MTFADLDNQLLLQDTALARLTEEEFYGLCQHNELLRLERTADRSLLIMPPRGAEFSRELAEDRSTTLALEPPTPTGLRL